MNWSDLFAAVALLLILEGVLPFLAPGRWRSALAALGRLDDGQLRWLGLGSMLAGLVLLIAVRGN